MIELAAGALLGLILSGQWGLDPGATTLVVPIVAMSAYMLSCWRYPYRPCWWCGGKLRRGDRRGNYRVASCWICGGGSYVRLGARWLGRG